jgi:hypothetical protein
MGVHNERCPPVANVLGRLEINRTIEAESEHVGPGIGGTS